MNSDFDELLLIEIASQSHISVENVRRTYQSILSDLRAKAKIHDFIPLLAMNCVRQHFRDLNPAPDSPFSFNVVELCEEKSGSHLVDFEQHYAH